MTELQLNREYLAERDLRIFKMRQAGIPVNEIARRFGITTPAVNTSIKRQLEKLNKEALIAYPEILRLELERLDALQQAIWPLTQHRKIKTDDGTEIAVEPDLKAVAEVRAIMAARAKLLGIDQTNINLNVEQTSPQRAILADATEKPASLTQHNPEEEARKMLQVMAAAGIIPDTLPGLLPPQQIETTSHDQ
jgi:hypothetical protein